MTDERLGVTCMVVPCYNEADRLRGEAFLEFNRSHPRIHFCFVDDGSGDRTGAVIEQLALEGGSGFHVVRLSTNAGKGEAVRQGVLHVCSMSRYDTIGYVDADLSAPLEQLLLLLEPLERRPDVAMAFGSRVRLLGRPIERWAVRHYLGRIFATAASLILGLAVYDTQCGAKILRAGTAEQVFASPFIGKWVFDVEMFARLVKLLGAERASELLLEIPLLEWRDAGDSRIRFSHLLRVPVDLARIAMRYRR